MSPVNRKPTLIVKSLSISEAYRELEDDRQRDTRPGRFAVTGQFIQLPDLETVDRALQGSHRGAP